jgi:amino acid adenylation domain-containing protein
MKRQEQSGGTFATSGKRALLKRLLTAETAAEIRFGPLSYGEERLWFLNRLTPGSPVYCQTGAARLLGRLDEAAFHRAHDEIVRRHEILRTRFPEIRGQPMRVVGPPKPVEVHRVDLAHLPPVQLQREVQDRISAQSQTVFDPARGPMFRSTLIRLNDREHVFVFTLHHMIADGWSMGVFLREAIAVYASLGTNSSPDLPRLPMQYGDYARWQRQSLHREIFPPQLDYWQRRLRGAPPLEMPTDFLRPARQSFRGSISEFEIGPELHDRVKTVAAQETATPFAALLSCFYVLLHHYTGSDDLSVGTPIANRHRGAVSALIGFFVNTLVLRTRLTRKDTFRTLVRRVRDTVLEAQAHQDLPFEHLVDAVEPARDLSRNPLFQTMFVLQNMPLPKLEFAGLDVVPLRVDCGTSKFDLTLFLEPHDAGMHGRWEYGTDLYLADTIERFTRHYLCLLDRLTADPSRQFADVSPLSESERTQVLVQWNCTPSLDAADRCLHELFEEQVARSPDSAAVSCDEGTWTYRELNQLANRLARRLRSEGVGPGAAVAVCAPRSCELVAALLAIMKAGGAYLPVDPDDPDERIAGILAEAGVRLALIAPAFRPRLPPLAVPCVDLASAAGQGDSADNLDAAATSRSPAYIIYTSGSTGRPKGVMIPHGGVCNRLRWMQSTYPLAADDCVLQKTPYTFDVSVWEFFWALLCGARLVLAKPGGQQDPHYLADLMRRHQVTTVHFVPSMLRAFLDAEQGPCPALRRAFCSGEALGTDLARWFYRQFDAELHNLYGPTECSVDATAFAVPRDLRASAVPIGRPIANAQAYILDRQGEPVACGVPGHLHLAGAGLALGYVRRPDLTAAAFAPNPFGPAGSRLYRTGDLARYGSDGNIVFLGRIDHQVKVRGMRIELGEVEAALANHPDVQETIVVARPDHHGEARLVAYVVQRPGAEWAPERLRSHLECRLPASMIPSVFCALQATPRTSSGKIDRRSLPAPEWTAAASRSHYLPPRNATEAALAEIWAEVLGVPRIGIHDNFFDLGGHSLCAIQIISRVRERFQFDLPVNVIFARATIAELALMIERRDVTGDAEMVAVIPKIARDGFLPVSFAQERLWFLQRLDPTNPVYNLPLAVRLTGTLNRAALETALRELVARHEALRTCFREQDGVAMQQIMATVSLNVAWQDLSSLDERARRAEVERQCREEPQRSFNPSIAPLLRACVLRLGECEHVLLITTHHLVCDGWSAGILLAEFAAAYEAENDQPPLALPAPAIQYADFAAWQRQQGPHATAAALAYWQGRLAGSNQVLNLPTDRPRRAVGKFVGRHLYFALDEGVVRELRAWGRQRNVTLFSILASAFAALLARWTGQNDLCFGVPVAGRTHRSLEGVVGHFVNVLILRADICDNPSLTDLVRRIHSEVLEALAHQELPFERLVQHLQPDRDLSRNPLYQAMFILQNAPLPKVKLPGLEISVIDLETGVAKVDLTVSLAELGDRIEGFFEYDATLFDDSSIAGMLTYFRSVLNALISFPHLRLEDVEGLSAEERRAVVGEANRTRRVWPACERVWDWVLQQARATPGAQALSDGSGSVSYGELADHVACRSAQLQARGVGPGTRVAVCLPRSIALAESLAAVWQAGAAYVPLDPEHPAERLAWVIEDVKPVLLVTARALRERTAGYSGPVLYVDNEDGEAITPSATAEPPATGGDPSLAYVLYTSGSTGRPKGVCITHAALLNLLHAMQELLQVEGRDRMLSLTTFSFDIAGLELWLPLVSGAQVVLVDPATARDGELLRRAVEHHRPSLLQATPAGWQLLIAAGWPGAAELKALVGGEAVGADLARALLQRCAEAWNLYGPTETAVWSTACRLAPEDRSISIGSPIHNTECYVLDARLRPVPAGVAGELYLGGAGLARGYWARPAETAARFMPHPFAAEPGRRLYKTGDRVRRQSDGRLQFLGRLDQQVKLRGFRIELGEIESRLREHPAIREAVVLLRRDQPNRPRLTAYVVRVVGRDASGEDLRAYLANLLPEYMLPSAWVELDALPLSPHGKVDRKALPAQTSRGTATANTGWRTETERELAQAWREVLDVPNVGRDDNFFHLGGHSLTALKLLARVRERWNLDVPVPDMFLAPTLAALAASIDEAAGRAPSSPQSQIPQVDRKQELPLSFGQQRLWLIEQLQPGAGYFRIPLALRLLGRLDHEMLAESFRDLVRRHEILRTTFPTRDGRPYQSIQTDVAIDLPVIDLTALAWEHRESEARREAEVEARHPFDLTQGPLIRTRLLRLEAEHHVLLITLHHIVCDGWSLQLLLRDAVKFYLAHRRGEASGLADLPVQYADFAVWERASLDAETLGDQADYWRRQLDNLPRSDLPGARATSASPAGQGATHAFVLPAPLVDCLTDVSRAHGTTLFTTLLSAFAVVLHSYDGREDIPIGIPEAGRDRVDVENLVGLFVNPLVVRARLEGRPTFPDVMTRIGLTTQGALANSLPFEEVVRILGTAGTGLHTPLFRAWFTFQETVIPPLKVEGLEAEVLETHNGAAMFELALLLRRIDAAIAGVIEYDTDVFTRPVIRSLAARFEALLQAVSIEPQQTLSNLRRTLEGMERQSALAAAERFKAADARALCQRKRSSQVAGRGDEAATTTDHSTAVCRGPFQPLGLFVSVRWPMRNEDVFGSPSARTITGRRKNVGSGARGLVRIEPAAGERGIPCLVRPAIQGIDLVEWATGQAQWIAELLLQHRALLFRGFDLDITRFGAFVRRTSGELLEYRDRSTPRQDRAKGIYTSTIYPAREGIQLHNEGTYWITWPLRIHFYCHKLAERGGETPIADVRGVLSDIDPELRKPFEKKQIMYVRNYNAGLGLPWQDVFQTGNRRKVEDYCRRNQIAWEWLDGEQLRTRQIRPAIRRHPQTGEPLWFNHAAFFNLAARDESTRQVLSESFRSDALPFQTYYGDGTPIAPADVQHIMSAYLKRRVVFSWQLGDLLVLDNMTIAHGRSPFTGTREVLTAMTQPVSSIEPPSA